MKNQKKINLTISQLKYIMVIGTFKSISITEIAKKLNVTKQSTSRMVSYLSLLGYVVKEKNENYLSELGLDLYNIYKTKIEKVKQYLIKKGISKEPFESSLVLSIYFDIKELDKLIK